jgi:hypothetical protein
MARTVVRAVVVVAELERLESLVVVVAVVDQVRTVATWSVQLQRFPVHSLSK